MTQEYRGYVLTTGCRRLASGRYSVSVTVRRASEKDAAPTVFDDPTVSLILPQEAEKESLNLGRNVIDRGLVPASG